MPLTSAQKTALNTLIASVATNAATLKPADEDQRAVLQMLRRFEKELPRIQDHRGK
jgi:hypothetical protein